MGTTNTKTATTITTITSTKTTSTITKVTSTKTTVTTQTVTTTTSTVTTITSSTTKTSIPCLPCAISIVTGCSERMMPGETCTPNITSSPCIESTNSGTLTCPSSNSRWESAPQWGSTGQVPKV